MRNLNFYDDKYIRKYKKSHAHAAIHLRAINQFLKLVYLSLNIREITANILFIICILLR